MISFDLQFILLHVSKTQDSFLLSLSDRLRVSWILGPFRKRNCSDQNKITIDGTSLQQKNFFDTVESLDSFYL